MNPQMHADAGRFRRGAQLLDGRIDLVGDEEVEAQDVVRGLATAAPVVSITTWAMPVARAPATATSSGAEQAMSAVVPAGMPSARRRPVVICTAPPTRFSGRRTIRDCSANACKIL